MPCLAGCGGTDDGSSDPSTDSASEALELDSWGACIEIGVTTHNPFPATIVESGYAHAYMHERSPLRTRTVLNLQFRPYGGGEVVTESRSGVHNISFTWNNPLNANACARVYAKDPCSGKWVSTRWTC
jgi:hypothetical protein